jgi:hypothetical protein
MKKSAKPVVYVLAYARKEQLPYRKNKVYLILGKREIPLFPRKVLLQDGKDFSFILFENPVSLKGEITVDSSYRTGTVRI